jgi:GlpG protein
MKAGDRRRAGPLLPVMWRAPMRQIASLPRETARTFADYLLTLKIHTSLQPDGEAVAVWICDEDQVAQARQELDEFTRKPDDPRYQAASPAAEALRRQEAQVEDAYNRRQMRLSRSMAGIGQGHRPLTVVLITVSVGVAIASNLGSQSDPVLQALHISSFRIHGGMIQWPFLSEIRSGQVWRLVTPIFIHFGIVHLVLNCLSMLYLGTLIETRRGTLRFLLLVLVLAVASNLCEYYLGRSTIQNGRLILKGAPLFGGLSGVIFGLFGYAWAKSRLEPKLGLVITRESVLFMLAWFVLCVLGVFGPIANVAHGSGLLLGLAIGAAPTLWRRLRRGGDQLDV